MAAFDGLRAKAISTAIMKAYDMLMDDFDGNLPRVAATVDKFAGTGDSINEAQLRLFDMVMGYMGDPTNNWRRLVDHVRLDIDPGVSRAFVQNFLVNSVVLGGNRQRQVNESEGCNCPWAILMDPTTACNLHCNGCWAANYEDAKHKSLTYEELDDIISQGTKLGTYVYLYTGGEPMVRKHDLIRLCEAHPDCFFSAFTNGTLVDEEFADEMLRVRNFMPAFSIEGFEQATDARRGAGTFKEIGRASCREIV